jgi:hypothetical protein
MTGLPEKRPAALPTLELIGPSREQGRQHGEAFRPLIRTMDSLWRDDVRRDLDMNPDDYLSLVMEKTSFLKAAQLYSPDLLEEVRGIAEGSGLDFSSVFARQLCDEDWWLRFEIKYGAQAEDHCSSLGFSLQTRTIVAQNMDTPSYWDGQQVLLHYKNPNGMETFVFTAAGSMALCGMNNAGVGVCCNTILQCNHSRDGLPEQFVVRSMLKQRSRKDAEQFLRTIPHASPQNYIVGDQEGVEDFEISANQIARFRPSRDFVFHSNHPLVNDDQGQYHDLMRRLPEDMKMGMVSGSTTLARFSFLETALKNLKDEVSVDEVKKILSSPPVCVEKDEKRITLGCVIMELSPLARLSLSPGPPDSYEFSEYTFGTGR